MVRKTANQFAPFYYVLMIKDGDDPSNLIPLGSGLLSDHTTGGIAAFLLTVRKSMIIVKKTYQPLRFFVSDFSLAIINALLNIFNHEDIDHHFRTLLVNCA